MKTYLKQEEVIKHLREGANIYTDRFEYRNSYSAFYYYLESKDETYCGKIHHNTIYSLINKGIIYGCNPPEGRLKYSLI